MSDTPLSPHTLEDLLYLIRCGLDGEKPELARVERMDLPQLYRYSRLHSLSALVYTALESAWDGKPPAHRLPEGWKEAREAAFRGALLFAAERKALLDWCEAEGIWYLPLKGILLQEDYPKLGMREMADNDILMDCAYRSQIRQWFTARGYEAVQYGQGIHDDYHKPPIFNFEIHSALFDVRAYPQWRDYLEHVEERFLPLEGTRYGRRFSQEDFFLYMMAHIYKHFCWGGTGLRSLVNCWVFSRARENSLDWAYLDAESRKMGMGDFVSQTQALAEGLFGKPRPLTDAERELLAYCLASGTYGTGQHLLENKLRSALDGGGKRGAGARLRYLCRRLFPRRDYLELWCGKFAPFFLRHPRLMPLAYPCRLARDFAHKAWKKGWRELRTLWKV